MFVSSLQVFVSNTENNKLEIDVKDYVHYKALRVFQGYDTDVVLHFMNIDQLEDFVEKAKDALEEFKNNKKKD